MVQDGGWTAREAASGRALELRRANGPFMALTLPAGVHRVALRYSPPGFRAGVVISALTVLVALGLALADRRRAVLGA